MGNHPNRAKHDKGQLGRKPRPPEILAARTASGLTQTEAAELIYCSLRAWQDWEGGQRPMHPAFWELWKIRAAERGATGGTSDE
jgi:putative transcriptional regulator